MKKIIALLALIPTLTFAQNAVLQPSIGPQQVPTTTGASALTTNSAATGTGTSQAGANNAGNAQSLALNSYGSGHTQALITPNVQGNGFYGSVSPDSCTTSQGGGAAGWLVGFNFVAAHDAMLCYGLRTYERVMQFAVNLPSIQQVYAWQHPLPDEKGRVPAPFIYNGMTREEGMDMALDQLCLLNDRTRAAMEKRGRCKMVADIPTYDHMGRDDQAKAFDQRYAADHPGLVPDTQQPSVSYTH